MPYLAHSAAKQSFNVNKALLLTLYATCLDDGEVSNGSVVPCEGASLSRKTTPTPSSSPEKGSKHPRLREIDAVARNRCHKNDASTMTLLNHPLGCSLSTDEASGGIDVEYSAPLFGSHVEGVLTANDPSETEEVVDGPYHQMSVLFYVLSKPKHYGAIKRLEKCPGHDSL